MFTAHPAIVELAWSLAFHSATFASGVPAQELMLYTGGPCRLVGERVSTSPRSRESAAGFCSCSRIGSAILSVRSGLFLNARETVAAHQT